MKRQCAAGQCSAYSKPSICCGAGAKGRQSLTRMNCWKRLAWPDSGDGNLTVRCHGAEGLGEKAAQRLHRNIPGVIVSWPRCAMSRRNDDERRWLRDYFRRGDDDHEIGPVGASSSLITTSRLTLWLLVNAMESCLLPTSMKKGQPGMSGLNRTSGDG